MYLQFLMNLVVSVFFGYTIMKSRSIFSFFFLLGTVIATVFVPNYLRIGIQNQTEMWVVSVMFIGFMVMGAMIGYRSSDDWSLKNTSTEDGPADTSNTPHMTDSK